MTSYLADTSALLLASGPAGRQLGSEAQRIFSALSAGTVEVAASTTSLYEVWLLERVGKARISTSLGLWHQRLKTAGIVFLSLEVEDVLEARGLQWEHRDTHDRLIVATALRLGMTLITNDRVIRDWGGVPTAW